MNTDTIIAISSVISTIVGIGVLYVAYTQLGNVKEQLMKLSDNQRNATLMSVLEMESEIFKRKSLVDNAAFEIRELGIAHKNSTPPKEILELLSDKHNIAIENYLNSLDRFCYCIIHKYISDRDWRTEYRDVIFEAVDNNEDKFGKSSRFRNTINLYDKWKEE